MQTLTHADSVISSLPAKVQKLLAMKGQFVSITYGKECKVRKGRAPIQKFSKMTLRCGVEYDNIAAVQGKRESGELPSENQGLSWGAYVPGLYPYILEHKGSLYFRFFTVPSSNRVAPSFARNGVEISRDEAREDCLASEFQERETTLETIVLKIEGILEINGQEV